ncbi:MAG TPA: DUF4390 domain-containing protein [Gammaproteobacteria bacterium]|nr:DUF4390 domain-containing protein [Gammaproteobacteria bacterium]
MVSFTRACKGSEAPSVNVYSTSRDGLGRRGLRWAVLLLCLFSVSLQARETRIYDTRTMLVDGVYRVGAHIEFDLNDTLNDALRNGVPLTVELRIEVLRERRWLWPETVAELRQRFELQYHALSRSYLVRNYSTGAKLSFPTLEEALAYIGNVYNLPLIDAHLLEPDQRYLVRMRVDIDVEALPTPVRLWAYLSSQWSLKSDWKQWPLQP